MNKIPKKIHFCWFGGNELSDLAKKCIYTWNKKLPDYEIKMWSENNFDINSNIFIKQAYESKKWAFVSDYVRLWALYNEGGIYLDTDVEILRSIDAFLDKEAFMGFENKYRLSSAIIGSKKNNKLIGALLDYYNDKSFYNNDMTLNLTPNTQIITQELLGKGLKLNNKEQVIENNLHIYPKEYFSPKSGITKKINITQNSYCIHQFDASWVDNKTGKSLKVKIRNAIIQMIGEDNYIFLSYRRQGILRKQVKN